MGFLGTRPHGLRDLTDVEGQWGSIASSSQERWVGQLGLHGMKRGS